MSFDVFLVGQLV